MNQSITILVGDKVFAVYQPQSPTYDFMRSVLGIPTTIQSCLSLPNLINTVSSIKNELKVPKLTISEGLFKSVDMSSFTLGSESYKQYELSMDDAWIPSGKNVQNMDTVWIQIKCHQIQQFIGIYLQGRSAAPQWVTKFRIMTSTDGSNYIYTFNGKQFCGCQNQTTIAKILFNTSIKTKYLRIAPTKYHGYPALRFDAMIIKDI